MDQQLESSEDFPIKTFLELNQLHHSNYSGMMQRLNEYGPKPLGKVIIICYYRVQS
jgi:transposase